MKPSRRSAVGVMARAPSAPGKTRLAAHLSERRLRALRTALLADALDVVAALDGVDPFVFFTPDDAEAEIASWAGASFTLQRQGGGDLGGRMRSAFDELLITRGYRWAILVGSDMPLLTAAQFAAAREALSTGVRLVLGPADDGGYYLIGMRSTEARLFEGISWGTASVLSDTLHTARRLGLDTRLLERACDIDTIEDVRRLERDLASVPGDVARHTRAWLRAGWAG